MNFIETQRQEKESLKAQLKYILCKHVGCTNPITARQLASKLKQNERRIRSVIRDLITEGLPIAAHTESPPGYFLVTTLYEAKRYSESIKNRLIEDAIRRRDFNRSASLYLNQVVQGRLL